MPLVSTNHAPSVVTWALRVATHPTLGPWLLDDAHRFAAFYAMLSGRLQWPEKLGQAIRGGDAAARITIDEQTYQEWRKNPEHPFSGRLNPKFLEAFWEGTAVYHFAQHHSSEWQEMLESVQRAWLDACAKTSLNDSTDLLSALDEAQESDTPSVAPSAMSAGVTDVSIRTPLHQNTVTFFALNALFVKPLLNLNSSEMSVLEMAFLLRDDDSFRLWWDLMASDAHIAQAVLQAMLDVNDDDLDALIEPTGRLSKSQIVAFSKEERKLLPMSVFWHGWFVEPPVDEHDLFAKLMVPVRKQANAGALARFAIEDRTTIESLLRIPSQAERGLNVLVYGAKSVDKQGLVVDTLNALGLKGYTLASRIPDEDLPAACFVVQRYLASIAPESVLVLPKADAVLARTQRGRRQLLFFSVEIDDDAADSPAEHVLLLDNPIKTVWLVHATDRLSEENLGRFLYTCEVKSASRAERRVEVESVLQSLGLSSTFFADLSQHTRLSEQQLRSAARLADLLTRERLTPPEQAARDLAQSTLDIESMVRLDQAVEQRARTKVDENIVLKESLVRRAVEQSQKALNRREREDLRQPITEYSLDLLNTGGGFSVGQIIEALKFRPAASLCFWGIPGTGKTQLAEHIAVAIDKPILIKRASDLLDKYVGESEKLIRQMFMEARDEDAVLLLDEADTFLRDRSLAREAYEVARVNEVLQGMERFNGVFICTTNLFQHLDAAAMRRFTFKLQFLALRPEQRWKMFLTETGVNVETLSVEVQENWKERLTFMQNLAPGDFATVKRQCHLLNTVLTPEQWLTQLDEEMAVKSQAMRSI